MGAHRVLAIGLQQLPSGQHAIVLGPQALQGLGCNLQVEVATATAFVSNATNPVQRQSIMVTAHLDTGADITTISPVLAQHLGLVQTGVRSANTANGVALNPTYAIDLTFVGGQIGSTLSPRLDLNVGSCTLPFTMAAHTANPRNPQNFAMLIGRDVMASWHITWDGPTSTVIISD
jgi:hypothetical protein